MAASQAKLGEEAWLRLRREYEAPGANLSDLSRRYGVARPTIRERARREAWVRGTETEILLPAVHEGAPSGGSTPGAEDEPPKVGLTDQARSQLLLRHQRDWWLARKLVREAVKGLSKGGDGKVDTDKLADALDLSKVLTMIQKGERDAFAIMVGFVGNPDEERKLTGPVLKQVGNGLNMLLDDWARRRANGEEIMARG